MKSAAKDGRFLTYAITDDRKVNLKSAAKNGRFLIYAITDDRKSNLKSATKDGRFFDGAARAARAHDVALLDANERQALERILDKLAPV